MVGLTGHHRSPREEVPRIRDSVPGGPQQIRPVLLRLTRSELDLEFRLLQWPWDNILLRHSA